MSAPTVLPRALTSAGAQTGSNGSLSSEPEAGAARRLASLALVIAGVTGTIGVVELAGGLPSALAPILRITTFLTTLIASALVLIAARVVYGLALEVKRVREMGSYRLVEKLGEGGMGEVWRAEHRLLARAAAIKLIRPAAVGARGGIHGAEMMKRFEREAQATAALRSPHTIAVYDYGVAGDGTFHYVMELLDGMSLHTLVERFGPVPPERAVRFLRQACHSLAEAHSAGLVHRDVKPANIITCRQGLDVDFVKVVDFGLVKTQDGSRRTEASGAEGAFTGTPAFMAPEVALASGAVDARTDIYALGCVAYWLLTGRLVFDGNTAMQMVLDHVRRPPVPPSQKTTQSIPPALERIVMRCLAKDPGLRPAGASALSRELQWLGIEGRWTDEKARHWWEAHHDVRTGSEGTDLSMLRTQSMHGRLRPRLAFAARS